MRKKTHENFIDKIKKIHGDKYTVLGLYKGAYEEISVKHNECGNEWTLNSARDLYRMKSCPECLGKQISKSKFKKQEDFEKEISNLYNGEYQVASQYIGAIDDILIKHLKCGEILKTTPRDFLSGKKTCLTCKKKEELAKRLKEIKLKIYELVKDEYDVLSINKIDGKTKVNVKHNLCGKEYPVSPDKFYNGQRCPVCSIIIAHKKQTKTQDKFEKEVAELTNNEYIVIGKYINSHTKVLIKHNKCGEPWGVTPSAFLKGNRCPECSNINNPKGEVKIKEFLISNHVQFERQYKFQDCRNKHPLPFDFAVFNNDNNLEFLIEFQGLQHDKVVDYFGGEESFQVRKLNDSIKENYCVKNNIKLLKIHYKDLNDIENILSDYLLKDN